MRNQDHNTLRVTAIDSLDQPSVMLMESDRNGTVSFVTIPTKFVRAITEAMREAEAFADRTHMNYVLNVDWGFEIVYGEFVTKMEEK